MTVRERMTRNPVIVTPEDSLAVAQAKMHKGEFRQLPVVDGERLVGIITDRDIRRHGRRMVVARVKSAMTEDPLSVTPSTPIEEVARLLLKYKIGSLPVVEGEKLVGIISTSDIIQILLDTMASLKGRLDTVIPAPSRKPKLG